MVFGSNHACVFFFYLYIFFLTLQKWCWIMTPIVGLKYGKLALLSVVGCRIDRLPSVIMQHCTNITDHNQQWYFVTYEQIYINRAYVEPKVYIPVNDITYRKHSKPYKTYGRNKLNFENLVRWLLTHRREPQKAHTSGSVAILALAPVHAYRPRSFCWSAEPPLVPRQKSVHRCLTYS